MKYISRFINTIFDTLIILAEKFSSVVFLLCLVIVICFCIDFGYAIHRTMIYFLKNNILEISPMIIDSKIIITCITMYGAKSIIRKFSTVKERILEIKKNTINKEEGGDV